MQTSQSQKYFPLWIALAGLVISPLIMRALGLTPGTAIDVVIFAIAALGLNLLVGHTGLTSFGHGAFFGIGAYAAALSQKHWFEGQLVVPLLFAVVFSAVLATIIGALILRRKGVYFSLLTLAFSALTYAIAFRWTSFTGGENGLGNVVRPAIGVVRLDEAVPYLIAVSAVGWLVLFFNWRLLRSPFGHVMAAIRENEQRAQFQGYDTQRYKWVVFILSATITGLAGALLAFHHRFASADPTSVAFSGEMLAIVVIGGMHSLLGPVIGAFFYILFREFLSIWTPNWLLYFGLLFVGFIIFSPNGLVGVWSRIAQRWNPLPETDAAMSARKIYQGLPFPTFLQPHTQDTTALQVSGLAKSFGGVQAVKDCGLSLAKGIHALIGPNGSGKTTTFNLISGLFTPDKGEVRLYGQNIQGMSAHDISMQGLARSFQITNLFKGLTIYENLRLSLQARHPGRYNMWRDVDSYASVQTQTTELVRYLGLEGIDTVPAGSMSYGGQRLVDMGIALGCHPRVLLLDEPLAGLAAAERERVTHLVQTIQHHIPVLIVEHDLDRVLAISQEVTVMNDGNVLMSGDPEAVRQDTRVQILYTGSGIPDIQARTSSMGQSDDLLLSFEQVNSFYGKSHILNDASLNIRRGEIVALLGRNGAGKSTLLKTLMGLVQASSGQVLFEGRPIEGLSTQQIAKAGIGYVPQGRGLFAGMSVRDYLALGRMTRLNPELGGVCWDEAKILDYFPRLKERMDTDADYLSGGEQQMVAVARALSGNVKLLLLDEPFEGLAPTVVNELFTVFDRLRSEISILIVEHNLDLVLALSDRVFALERGQVFHEGPSQALLTDLDYRKKILWM